MNSNSSFMKLKDLSSRCKGVIDVFVILETARDYELFANEAFGDRANIVYFTPSTSHNVAWREQKVEGNFSPERAALVLDISWWKGNAFREAVSFLTKAGYCINRIYGYSVLGKVSPHIEGPQEFCDSATNILELLSEPS